MTRHDDLIRIRHMLDAAREAVELAKGRTADDIRGDRLRHLAIERLLEIVGEAAAQAPADVRQRHPGIPWNRIVGMRNEIIHGYSSVDLEIVVKTITENIPALIRQLEDALTRQSG
jgi:uncharacterized protein with HEPN domain